MDNFEIGQTKATKRGLINKLRDLQDTLAYSELTPATQLEIFKELNNIQLKVLADKPEETKGYR